MNKALSPVFHLSLCTLGCLYASSTQAQVTSDGTVNTQVTPNGNVAEITGGETRGGNLFHSFRDFSVGTGNEASFNNATNISNIFSRVTGGNISNIDGLIRANGSANLFLINPAGIIFGENARLNVGGSFYGSSASSILFEDGEFSATDLDNPPVLTINAPIGLGFRDNPEDITNNSIANNGKGLEVNPGNNISLLGGNVNFDGGNIFAPGGRVEIGGLATDGNITFVDNGLSFPENIVRGNVSLTNSSQINVRASNGGNIAITAQNVELLDETNVRAGIDSPTGSSESKAGNIDIDVIETITLGNLSLISNAVIPDAMGNAGDVNVSTNSLLLAGGSQISSSTFGQGNSGDININANTITFSGEGTPSFIQPGAINANRASGVLNNVEAVAIGNAGVININANSLAFKDGAQIQSLVRGAENDLPGGRGNGGIVNLDIRDTLAASGASSEGLSSGIVSNIDSGAIGNGGGINIKAGMIKLDSASFNAQTLGEGNAGNIDLQVDDSVSLANSSYITSTVGAGAIGNGGNVSIEANSLALTEGSQVQAGIFGTVNNISGGRGNGGIVNLNIRDTLTASRLDARGFASGVFTTVNSSGAKGNGGDINVNAGSILLIDGASFNASTFGEGNAGNIFIQAIDSISLEANSLIESTVGNGAIGNGGDIDIQARSLSLLDGSQIAAAVFRQEDNSTIPGGQGNGGDIRITTTDFVNISGFDADSFSSGILTTTEQGAKGQAGDITVNTNIFRASNSGNINSGTRNSSNGGDITINTDIFEAISGGQVRATTRSNGNAGNITLNTSDKTFISGSDSTFAQRLTQFGENKVSDAGAASGLFVNSTPESTGQAGSLILNTRQLTLSDQGTISASTQSGFGGNIFLQIADDLILSNNSLISAEARGKATGGNVNINANSIVAFPNKNSLNGNSDIRANAEQGKGGNIDIKAESLFGIEERPLNDSTNDINARSEFDLDGSVNINTSDINPVQGATELPSNIVEPKQIREQACSVNPETKTSNGLTFVGKGNVAPAPDLPLNSHNIIDGETNSAYNIPEPIETSQGKIQPARGIKVTQDGRIILTAYRTNDAGERIPEIKPNCSKALTNLD